MKEKKPKAGRKGWNELTKEEKAKKYDNKK